MAEQKQRRNRRGLVLSEAGIARVNRARRRLELDCNDGARISLDELGFRAGLSAKTMSRLFSREVSVDRRTIELLFSELGLTLGPEDVSPPAARVLTERSELPHYRTALFGRDRELARLSELAQERMVVTLTGPGGVGKTRLAVEWMRRNDSAFSHIAFLDLSLLTDGATLRESIGSMLDAATASGGDVLLVLDGCEHLIKEARIATDELLDKMPHLSVLATSREPLGIAGEGVLRLAPLAVPEPLPGLRAAAALGYPAFAMFVERARSFDDGFTLGDEAVPVVAEVVRSLDGVPLALEIAAARAAFMSLPDLLASLRDHLEALSQGTRIGVPRHRSARALIDWSFELLTQPERDVFMCLGAFMGSFSLEAVVAVCEGRPPPHALGEILTELGRKSLLIVDTAGSLTRFRMLETIRQYAAAKLSESGDANSVRQHHALYYHEVASAAAYEIATPARAAARRRFEIDTPNLREALEWSINRSRNVYLGAAIAAEFIEVWEARGDFAEAEHWLRRALESESELLTLHTQAKLLEGLALVKFRRGHLMDAVTAASNALEKYASIGDFMGKLRARGILGLAVLESGELEVARDQFEATLSEARTAGDHRAISASLNNVGRIVGEYEGRFDAAMPLFAESLATASSNGLISESISALTNLSKCTLALGQYSAGLTYARLGIAEAEKVGNREAAADLALQAVAHCLRSEGLAAAREDAVYAVEAIADVPYRPHIAARLDDVAVALHSAGQPRRAATLLGASEAFRRRGEQRPNVRFEERHRVARAEIAETLLPGEAEALSARGASLLLHDALRGALLDLD